MAVISSDVDLSELRCLYESECARADCVSDYETFRLIAAGLCQSPVRSDWQLAINSALRLIKDEYALTDAYYSAAVAYTNSGQYVRARRCVDHLAVLAPTDTRTDAVRKRVDEKVRSGQYQQRTHRRRHRNNIRLTTFILLCSCLQTERRFSSSRSHSSASSPWRCACCGDDTNVKYLYYYKSLLAAAPPMCLSFTALIMRMKSPFSVQPSHFSCHPSSMCFSSFTRIFVRSTALQSIGVGGFS